MSDNEEINLPTIRVYANVIYGLKKISDVEVILTNDDTGESFTGVTDSNGECTITIIGSVDELGEPEPYTNLLRDYLVEVSCEHYSTNTNILTTTSDDNQLVLYLVKLDDCQNQILTNKNCKYFHHEPYMTPNNFDLYFDPAKIPSNIIQEPPHELLLRLQATMPLTDILHLNLEKEQNVYSNVVKLHSTAKLKFNTRDLLIQSLPLKIFAIWEDYTESEQLCNKSYEIHYLYDNTIAMSDVVVKLTNKNYPLIHYAQKTDSEGKCTFKDLPYGSYIQELITSEYTLPQTLIEVNCEEETTSLVLGSTLEDSTLDFYINGILSSNQLTDARGKVVTDGNVDYDMGVLTINGSNELSEEEMLNVLLNSDDEEDNVDFTEFTVKIIDINQGTGGASYSNGRLESLLFEYDVGLLRYDEYVDYYDGYLLILTDGTVVDEVTLNGYNNYSAETVSLPIFEEGTNNKVFYQVSYNKKYCTVQMEDIDNLGLDKNEVVLF